MRRLTRTILAGAAVICLLCTGPAVTAQVPATTQNAALPTASVMIVLDASGSMTTTDAPGSRIDAAKRAVIAMVNSLPAASRVGLLVYGTGTGSGDAEKALGCQDVQQLIPVGPVNRAAFIAAVQGVRARGYTPMGAALEKAAAALPKTGPASIVLVSDGIDTCAPPSTCEVAQALEAGGRDLVIHTVGFRVDATARAELACTAQAGGGTYRYAGDAAGLTAVLQGQVDAGLRPYIVAGSPISGTPAAPGAPHIAPGQYTDSMPAGETATEYYAVDLIKGQTAYLATTLVPPALRGGGATSRLAVTTQLQDQQGHRCLPTQRAHDTVLAGKVDPVTALITGVVGGPNWSKRCPADGLFILAVTRDNASKVPTRSEIIVRVEQSVGNPPAAAATVPADLPAPAVGNARAISGGASFNDAPAIGNGTYRDTLSTGETRYYQVRVGWGQRLAYQVVLDGIPGLAHGVGYGRTALATPLRQELALSYRSNAAHSFGGLNSVALTGSTLVPVEYANRNSDISGIRGYGLAGDYYLSVGMSYPVDTLPYRTGISIAVQVVGAVQPGPDYEPVRKKIAASDGAAATSAPPTAISSKESAPAERADPAPAGPVTAIGAKSTAPSASADRATWWTWALGIIVVVAVGTGGIAVRRRRSSAGR